MNIFYQMLLGYVFYVKNMKQSLAPLEEIAKFIFGIVKSFWSGGNIVRNVGNYSLGTGCTPSKSCVDGP
jgi:hypothetical protein